MVKRCAMDAMAGKALKKVADGFAHIQETKLHRKLRFVPTQLLYNLSRARLTHRSFSRSLPILAKVGSYYL